MQAGADRFFTPRDSEGKPTEIRYIAPIVARLEYPPVIFTTKEHNHISCGQVNAFYETLLPGPTFGPRHFLVLYDKLLLAHEGNFPVPGWNAYMVSNYFLERCNIAFDGEDGHKEWKETVLMPKKGVANAQAIQVPTLKTLITDQAEACEMGVAKKPRLVSHSRMLHATSGRYARLRDATNKANGY